MKSKAPKLTIYTFTGFICCKCGECGWSSKTPYVNGETADQTVRRAFGKHRCSSNAESALDELETASRAIA